MKCLLTLSAFILYFSAQSQQPLKQYSGKDSFVSCLANWKLGETKIYSIVHEKGAINPSEKKPPFIFAYEAWVSVTDSTAKDYTIKWVFHLPAQITLFRPGLADSLPVYNGMEMIFRITGTGEFIELMNWEQVRDAYSRMMELSLPKTGDSTAAAVIQSAKEMFNSREMVETSMIREIRLFHTPLGYKFTPTEAGTRTEIANPFGGDPFPAIQTTHISGLDPKKDSFTLDFNLRVDKANTKSIIDSLFKKMNIPEDQEMQTGREKFARFDMQDISEYNFIRSSGWISRLYFKRTIVIAGMTQYDSYTMTLKE